MAGYVISPAAQVDIETILAWTHEHFGERARMRYEALLMRAIQEVSANPVLTGSHSRPEIAVDARTYDLFHSRNHVPAALGRVKQPKHFLLYRVRGEGQVEIGRVLHESMDLARHLPDDYRA